MAQSGSSEETVSASSHLHPSAHTMRSLYLDGGQVNSWSRCRGRGGLRRWCRCRCRCGFGLLDGSLRVLLGCHCRCGDNYFVPETQAIPGEGDNTRRSTQTGGDSEQEITVWAYIYEAIFPPGARQGSVRVRIGWRTGGVCVRTGVLSKQGKWGRGPERVYLRYASLIE